MGIGSPKGGYLGSSLKMSFLTPTLTLPTGRHTVPFPGDPTAAHKG